MKILVIGASGSGTTTLGQILGNRLDCRHLDLDDYYWIPTSPPYRQKRDGLERLQTLQRDLHVNEDVIASGSLVGWGRDVEDAFDLIVFLFVATQTRLARIRRRETERFGTADPAFLTWASQYDEGPPEGRSLAKHESWLGAAQLSNPSYRRGHLSPARVRRVMDVIELAANRPCDT